MTLVDNRQTLDSGTREQKNYVSPATFVLVHGAWHGGWCWSRVASRLRQCGHLVFTPTLTGLADRGHLLSPNVNLSTHVIDIVNLIRWEELTSVILVGHSYGGAVISEVVEEVPDAIGSIVFLDAFMPENGRALYDYTPEPLRQIWQNAICQNTNNSVPPIPAAVFKVNERDRAMVDAKCTPQPFAALMQKLKLTGARERVTKKAYIRAEHYASAAFQACYESRRSDPSWRTFLVPAGHDVMLDAPDELANILMKLT